MAVLFLDMLSSIFGQFVKDTVLLIPISLVSSVILVMFVFDHDRQRGLVPVTRSFVLIRKLRAFFVGFLFRDSSEGFRPWVVVLFSLFFLLLCINILGMLPYSMTLTSHVSFTYRLAFPF